MWIINDESNDKICYLLYNAKCKHIFYIFYIITIFIGRKNFLNVNLRKG